ncbi:MAG: type II toxin-antitoxin system RelE/ParE family toxin [Rhodoferax sp.]|nr:type II toxin-antitoxin system RelE/ParE family toxin [Rhodoferax sp.]MCP5290273.1 type II toxin-antitoxin system RelE/ParE family toxin [Burkholderiaceae bacterium]
MKPSIHRLAEQDLRDAAGFYRREAGAGVALRFLAEFERIVDLLVSEPGIGTPTAGGRQAFPLAGFPYSVIYRQLGDEIRVLVVRHQRRDPGFGDSRS